MCLYNKEEQIGEMLKVQVVIDGKDTYRVYLKDEYSQLADACMMLALYLDRIVYNSSYLKIRGQSIQYSKTYSKINKYYNPNWVKENFDAKDYFEQVEQMIQEAKKHIKQRAKITLSAVGIGFLIAIVAFVLMQ